MLQLYRLNLFVHPFYVIRYLQTTHVNINKKAPETGADKKENLILFFVYLESYGLAAVGIYVSAIL